MALTKRIVYGSSLDCDPAGGSTFVEVASIVDGWDGPNAQADEIDTTVLADSSKTSSKGQIDPGTVSLTIAYDPADTNSQILVDLFDGCDVAAWQVNLSAVCEDGGGTVSETFTGWIKEFGVTAQGKENLVQANIVIRVTGDPGFTGST